jgi:hypothetical protein
MEVDRLVYFSDAVVEISVPAATENVGDALLDRWPQFLSRHDRS